MSNINIKNLLSCSPEHGLVQNKIISVIGRGDSVFF